MSALTKKEKQKRQEENEAEARIRRKQNLKPIVDGEPITQART